MKIVFNNPKVKKYIEYFVSIIKKIIYQKEYKAYGQHVKYIFQKCPESKSLIIVFSACTRAGIPARYNYMRTLNTIKTNKLFILDDFGKDKRGSFYLGSYPDYNFESATISLIKCIQHMNEIDYTFYCGSSKGGWSALNFGLMDAGPGDIIIGAPQYWLGKYLSAEANRVALESMSNGCEKEKVVASLNRHLKERIDLFKGEKPSIFIHYSDNEHTYYDHVVDLLKELKEEGFSLTEDIEHYSNHWDVSFYYPKFLLKVLEKYSL